MDLLRSANMQYEIIVCKCCTHIERNQTKWITDAEWLKLKDVRVYKCYARPSENKNAKAKFTMNEFCEWVRERTVRKKLRDDKSI